ncbi:hypothetical protein AXF42_Ash001143 [Apostasia shenzhenica]|uniref:Transcription repressor n=1 Tax=Apostasia shenzhenica TaxID=1088818 RepID=A0A2I0AU33_9ASPA|nr:hypothetical protein AXF42_Ash001143 [Apostasia shenzhenica]
MESKVRLEEWLPCIFRRSLPHRRSSGNSSTGTITTPDPASSRSAFAAASSRSLLAAGSSRSFSVAASEMAHEPIFMPRSRRTDLGGLPLALPRRSILPDRIPPRQLISGRCGGCAPTSAAPSSEKKGKGERRARESGDFYERRDGSVDGRTCPPASPSSVSNIFFQYDCFNEEEHKKMNRSKEKRKKKKKNMEKTIRSNRHKFNMSSNSFHSDDEDEFGFFNSDEETETFFSTRSFSSDSSEFYRRPSRKPKKNSTKKKNEKGEKPRFASHRQPRKRSTSRSDGSRPMVFFSSSKSEAENEHGFAFATNSSDPYGDFRSSMVEMILEKRILGAQELERLLHSYLSLNSPENHPVILRAFADIAEVLFSY